MSIAALTIAVLSLVFLIGPLLAVDPRPAWADELLAVGVLFLLAAVIWFVAEIYGGAM
jgi:hypothetical protein